MKKLIALSYLLLFSMNSLPASEECQADGDLEYICGPQNAEDIVQLGDSRWLITSGMDGSLSQTGTGGHIYLIDHIDKTWEVLVPQESLDVKVTRSMFVQCPGPLNPENFSAHGLALRETGPDQYDMYMTSHGAREAIEVFSIDASGDKPAITWIGCVPITAGIWANSVAILSDGGFVTTKFMDLTQPNAFGDIWQGKVTGEVYEWHPGGELTKLAGTELSGPNGILVSPDDRWVYVAAFGGRAVVRFERTNPENSKTAAIPLIPDNLRWGPDGRIYTAGESVAVGEACTSFPCGSGWSVLAIDPETLEAERVAGVDAGTALGSVSVGTPVGDHVWVGSFSADRIGYLPLKQQ